MRRKTSVWAVTSVVIIFLPIMLFGLMASVNEYEDQGIGGGVDCNGPLTVMLFNVPSLLVYAAAAVFYATLLKRVRQSLLTSVLMVICTMAAFAAGRQTWAACTEKNRPGHQETCGKGR